MFHNDIGLHPNLNLGPSSFAICSLINIRISQLIVWDKFFIKLIQIMMASQLCHYNDSVYVFGNDIGLNSNLNLGPL